MDCAWLSPDGLAPLAALSQLQELALSAVKSFASDGNRSPRLTSRELGYLYPLLKLRVLRLRGGQLRPGSLRKLTRRLGQLERLELTGCFAPDPDLRWLGELPCLRSLIVHGPSEYGEHPDYLGDAGLSAIAGARRLEELDLWRCKRITDAGVLELIRLPLLRRLTLGDPDHEYSPGDRVLERLHEFPALDSASLHLCGRSVTAVGWEALTRRDWARFELEACHLSAEGAAALAERFPSAEREGVAVTSRIRWVRPGK